MIKLEDERKIKLMREGGIRLAYIKQILFDKVEEGVTAWQIEILARNLIKKMGGEASFMMVPGYKWATCVNLNQGVVHGIPKREIVFKNGDLVSVDLGMYYKGFHTDTSFTKALGEESQEIEIFLETGKEALRQAISRALPSNYIYDISLAIESTLRKRKFSPVKALVGHGIGKKLHEDPQIPCFAEGKREKTKHIKPGLTIAIEVIYTMGNGEVKLLDDGWTIVTQDGKIAGLFEETIAVTEGGPITLTEYKI